MLFFRLVQTITGPTQAISGGRQLSDYSIAHETSWETDPSRNIPRHSAVPIPLKNTVLRQERDTAQHLSVLLPRGCLSLLQTLFTIKKYLPILFTRANKTKPSTFRQVPLTDTFTIHYECNLSKLSEFFH